MRVYVCCCPFRQRFERVEAGAVLVSGTDGRLACGARFFFPGRGRHTRFDCDWSSDVCSPDLAVRAAQLGLKVAVVEKDKTFGGTCLNVGCIPSKALLHASELYEEAGHTLEKMGIRLGTPKLDLPAMMKFKAEGVDGNVKGVAFLFKKNKIEAFQGRGKILAPGQVEIRGAEEKAQTIEAKAIVIA